MQIFWLFHNKALPRNIILPFSRVSYHKFSVWQTRGKCVQKDITNLLFCDKTYFGIYYVKFGYGLIRIPSDFNEAWKTPKFIKNYYSHIDAELCSPPVWNCRRVIWAPKFFIGGGLFIGGGGFFPSRMTMISNRSIKIFATCGRVPYRGRSIQVEGGWSYSCYKFSKQIPLVEQE